MSATATAAALDPTAYALGGRVPATVLRPGSAEAVAEALAAAARDRHAVVLWGGGVHHDRAAAPGRYDLALDLTALDRVLEYDPEDLTLTAGCGVTLARLREAVAARGQDLGLESAAATRATVGGVLATNTSGPRRRRFGAPRDRLLGARYALGDGTLARSGGKVVKNVAGFAIHRLLAGARGRCGALLEVSLKLIPAPESRVALVFAFDPLAPAAFHATLPRLEPAFATVLGPDVPRPCGPAGWVVVLGLEDDAPRVAEQEAAIAAALGVPGHRASGEECDALVQGLADAAGFEPRLELVSAHQAPAALAALAGLPGAAGLVFHAPAGRLHWRPGDGDPGELAAALFGAGFTPIAARGCRFPPAVHPEPAIGELRARLERALDPAGTLAHDAGVESGGER